MSYIKFFTELSMKDIPLVGGKNASLGEMIQQLKTLDPERVDAYSVRICYHH